MPAISSSCIVLSGSAASQIFLLICLFLCPCMQIMPLFRSQAASPGDRDAARRIRAGTIQKQIGCMSGFFQIFDQQPRKQIAGPEVPRPTQLQDHLSVTHPVSEAQSLKQDDSAPGAEQDACTDTKLPNVEASLAPRDMQRKSVSHLGPSNEQPTVLEEALPNHKRDKPKALKLKSGTVARHRSFNESRDMEHANIKSSLLNSLHGNAGSAGHLLVDGVIPLEGVNLRTQGRLSVGSKPEEERYKLSEERWEFWSSPAIDRLGPLKQEDAVDGVRAAWLAKGARAAERQWAAEESLEDWKLSLKALAKLREEGDAGTPGYNVNSGFVAPTASPREDVRISRNNEVPARASSFDFKDAIRLSQRTLSQAENSRRSWDDRDLPRSVAELRDAIHVRVCPVPPASPPPSPCHPSVVARLMGLDDLPKPTSQPTLNNRCDKKPSGEAKLLQQLLQYSPPSVATPSVSPSTPTSYSFTPSVSIQSTHDSSMRTELQSMLKRLEALSITGHVNPSGVKFLDAISNYTKLHESAVPPAASGWEESKPTPSMRLPAVKKPNQHNEGLPVVVLKQSEEIRSPSPRSSQYNSDDEIEKRLRQLGLQSSEQERKTLKQILEAMQMKGLLRPPDSPRRSEGLRRQQASAPTMPRFSESTAPAHTSVNGIDSWPSSPTTKGESGPAPCPRGPGKSDRSASIVIMRPISRVPASSQSSHRHPVSERATSSSSAEPKLLQNKTRSSASVEVSTIKETRSNGRAKGRSNFSITRNSGVSSQPPIQPRKLSSKVRHGAGRSLSQTSPSEKNQKSRSAISRSAGQQDCVARRASDKHSGADFDKIATSVTDARTLTAADLAQPSKMHLVDRRNEADFVLQGTPPRDRKASEESEDSFTKDVTEQCSPVSVLDAHRSDNEVEQSPKFSRDTNRALMELEMDGESCRLLVPAEWQQPQPEEQAAPIETIPAFNASNAQITHAFKDPSILPLQEVLHVPTCMASLVYDIKGEVQPDDSCDLQVAHTKSLDSDDWAIGGCIYEVFKSTEDTTNSEDEGILTVKECMDMPGTDMSRSCKDGLPSTKHDDAFRGLCDDKEFRMANMEDDMDIYLHNIQDEDVLQDCWDEEEYKSSSNAGCMDGDVVITEETLRAMDDICLRGVPENLMEADKCNPSCVIINGDYVDEGCAIKPCHMDESNVDFLYTDGIMRRAGLTSDQYSLNCSIVVERWLASGCEIPSSVFDELEEQWDAVHDAENQYIEGVGEDRDMGGELFRKSQQASVRRRLVFDCLNQILEGRMLCVGMPAYSCGGSSRQLPVAQVWSDLKNLEMGPASADDSMYAMLEQDLLKDVDYRHSTTCWRGMPTQVASVAQDLEKDMLDSLVIELLNEGLPS